MPHRVLTLATFLCVCLVALGVRWYQIGESLWLDELHSAWCVSGSASDVAPRAWLGNHSPLYFYPVRFAVQCFGASEVSLRLTSLIAGLLLVLIIGMLVKHWTRNLAAGVFAATLIALDPHCIFYSQETRPYALVQVLAWGHVAILWNRIQRPTWWNRICFVVGGILLIHVHYTAALFVLAEFVLLVAAAARSTKDSRANVWRGVILDGTLTAFGLIPVAWHVMDIATRRAQWDSMPSASTIDVVWIFQLDRYLLWPLLAVSAALLFHRYQRKLEWPYWNTQAVLVAAVLFIAPLTIAWTATVTHEANLLSRRYLMPSYTGMIVLAVMIWSTIPARWMRMMVTVVIVAAVLSGIQRQFQYDRRIIADRQQDWRAAVQFMNLNGDRQHEIALVRSGFLEEKLLLQPHPPLLDEYCLAPVRAIYRLDMEAFPLATPLPSRFDAKTWNKLENPRGAWFLIAADSKSRENFTAELKRELGSRDATWTVPTSAKFGTILVVHAKRR